MIVGQAPAERSLIDATPYGGQSNRCVTAWLAEAGLPAESWRDYVYFTAITRCYPGRARSGAGDRVPSRVERNLCRPFLDEELALLDPAIVLLFGQLSIRTLLGPGKLDDLVGTAVERDGRRWLPLPHPSGVSRWLNDPVHRAQVSAGLAVLRSWIRELGIVANAPTPRSRAIG